MTDSLVLRRTWARLVEARERMDSAEATARSAANGMHSGGAGLFARVVDARDLLATARDAWHVARGLEA